MDHCCFRMLYQVGRAIALKRPSGTAVASFIRKNIICRFGIAKRVLFNYGTTFINSHVRQLSEQNRVDHVKTSSYYPQENDQTEATSRTLQRIPSLMVYEEPNRWAQFIPLVLQAYRTSKQTSTQVAPFFLVYGAEAVVPIEVLVLLAPLTMASKISSSCNRICDVEAVDEK